MADDGIIDLHHHVIPDFYKEKLATIGIVGSGQVPWPDWSEQIMLDVMERNGFSGVMTTVTSPGHYFGDIEFTKSLVRQCNDYTAGLANRNPDKVVNLGVVPLPDVGAAVQEAEHILDQLKLPGVSLLSHYGDCYLGEPEHEEFYAELNSRKAVAFVHPVRFAPEDMPRYSYANGTTELVFDTTRAIVNLLYNGVFARYPNIKWIFSHCGGVMPFIAYRLRSFDYNPKLKENLPGGAEAVLGNLYVDTAQSAGPGPLKATMEIIKPDRIFFGTDYPFARAGDESVIPQAKKAIDDYDGWDAAMKQKVMRDNAVKLFPQLG